MGFYSPVTLSRTEAIAQITHLLPEATNEELSQALFRLTQDRTLDNYTVLSDVDYEMQMNDDNKDDK